MVARRATDAAARAPKIKHTVDVAREACGNFSAVAVVAAAVESSPADGFVAGLGVAVWIGILVVHASLISL